MSRVTKAQKHFRIMHRAKERRKSWTARHGCKIRCLAWVRNRLLADVFCHLYQVKP